MSNGRKIESMQTATIASGKIPDVVMINGHLAGGKWWWTGPRGRATF